MAFNQLQPIELNENLEDSISDPPLSLENDKNNVNINNNPNINKNIDLQEGIAGVASSSSKNS